VNVRFVTLSVVAAALLGLAACTSTTTGVGTAATTSSGEQTNGDTVPSSSNGSSELADVKPCDLLSDSVIRENYLRSKGPSTSGDVRTCIWGNAIADNGFGYALGVNVRPSEGLDSIDAAKYSISDHPMIGRHSAKQLRQKEGDLCEIAIGITPTSQVDVSSNTGTSDINEACALANRFASVIEPELP
jgi:hypothetical protein